VIRARTPRVEPVQFETSAVVGTTYTVRMRGRTTTLPEVFTVPSNEASVLIEAPMAGPRDVVIRLRVTISVTSGTP